MTPTRNTMGQQRTRLPARVAATILAGMAASLMPSPSRAAGDAEPGHAELEQTFWACDYAATQGRMGSPVVAACAEATEAFKQHRFDGDFDRMLAWWRLHKEERHAALEAVAQDLPERLARRSGSRVD